MANRKEHETLADFLHRGCLYYQNLGIPAVVSEPAEDAPYTALIVRLEDIGDDDLAIHLEIGFIPLAEFDRAGGHLLQTFAEIAPETASDRRPELLEDIAEINVTLPLGAFGLFPDGGPLYYKHNAMLKQSWLTEPAAMEQLDRQNGMILHLLHQYVDRLRGR